MLSAAYISVTEAVKHASWALGATPALEWINAEDYEKNPGTIKGLLGYDGIVVPGGFGTRGIEGIMKAVKFAREKKIPYFGLCYGMQLAVVEFARSVVDIRGAGTREAGARVKDAVIDILPEQVSRLKEKNYGGTMRLGGDPARLKPGTIARAAYGTDRIRERHRHRYEVNPAYIARLEKKGLVFSGVSPDGRLMEIAELPKSVHPFCLGAQFHPELTSTPLHPHPLFSAFIRASLACRQAGISRKK